MNKEQKRNFIIRACLWTLFSCVIPVIFIGWRYSLFSKVSSISLSGWGLIAVVIVFAFVIVVVKYIKAGFVEWNMLKQIINGIIKVVLPLGTMLAVCVSIRSNIDMFIQALSCTLLCEVIAIPINPFPKWVYEKSKGRFESTVDFIATKFYEKDKENKKGE